MIPTLKLDKECKVCGGCYLECSTKAIHFELGEQNYYPVVDAKLCIGCGICEKVCKASYRNISEFQSYFYIGNSKDNDVLQRSSSGGLFAEIAKYVLGCGGIVFGAAFDSNSYLVRHIGIESIEKLKDLQKSKYAQSKWIDIVSTLEHAIKEKRYILFSGTPCQVSSVKARYGYYSKILFVDLFCHGVSNARPFQDYLKSINSAITKVDFRHCDKRYSKNFNLNIESEDKVVLREYCEENMFYRLFISSAILKGACFECEYAINQHDADITLGDFNDLDYAKEKNISALHPSIIAINTEKGERIFEKIKAQVDYAILDNMDLIQEYYVNHEEKTGAWGYDREIHKNFEAEYSRYGFNHAAFNSLYAKEIQLIEKIDKVKKSGDRIYLYGAGVKGKDYVKVIRRLRPDWDIDSFIVTLKEDNPTYVDGIKVEEVNERNKDNIVIVSVTEKYKKEIINDLNNRGFTKIFYE